MGAVGQRGGPADAELEVSTSHLPPWRLLYPTEGEADCPALETTKGLLD